jgi:tRNA threonylcarbamoyladenosine biosynthesis protein TsaE
LTLFPIESRSVDETRRAGAEFVDELKPGSIVALEGELGSGKTEFVRGACARLGVAEDVVTSPTFTIVNEYEARALTVFHIDAYRLKSESEFYDLGYEDYFMADGITFIEWPDRLPTILGGEDVVRLSFEHGEGQSRRISRIG